MQHVAIPLSTHTCCISLVDTHSFHCIILQVTAIMVTHAVEYSGHGDFTDTVLLDNIAPQAGGADEPQG